MGAIAKSASKGVPKPVLAPTVQLKQAGLPFYIPSKLPNSVSKVPSGGSLSWKDFADPFVAVAGESDMEDEDVLDGAQRLMDGVDVASAGGGMLAQLAGLSGRVPAAVPALGATLGRVSGGLTVANAAFDAGRVIGDEGYRDKGYAAMTGDGIPVLNEVSNAMARPASAVSALPIGVDNVFQSMTDMNSAVSAFVNQRDLQAIRDRRRLEMEAELGREVTDGDYAARRELRRVLKDGGGVDASNDDFDPFA